MCEHHRQGLWAFVIHLGSKKPMLVTTIEMMMVISAAFGRNIKNSTCVSWPDCSDQYSFRSQLWSYFAFVSVLTWLSHSKHPTLCKMKMIFHMILCLSEHHDQHNTAALTRPMMWVWGGTICLSDQWEKCRMFGKLSTVFRILFRVTAILKNTTSLAVEIY